MGRIGLIGRRGWVAAGLLALVLIICGGWEMVPPPSPPVSVALAEDRHRGAGAVAKPQIILPVLVGDSISLMELEELVAGVVAAEMPASFAPAALQAQAVAARTYLLRHLPPDSRRHGQAAVCTASSCCQAWCDQAQQRQKWGDDYPRHWQAIQAATADTAGQVLTYDGQLCLTPFCSTCGGRSEAAAAAWSSGQPYLTSQSCGYCRHSPRLLGQKRLELELAAERLGVSGQELRQAVFNGSTVGQRVNRLELGGRSLRGVEVRAALGLDSAAFTLVCLGDEAIFSTLGYGHGVGLCQYGADGMAAAGFSYAEILAHYYPGTALALAEGS